MSKKDESSRTGTLTIVGIGEVKVQPDTAWVHLDVTTRGSSAQEAVKVNAEKMTEVIFRLKQLGLEDDSLHTSGVSVYPILQDQDGKDKGQIIGYGAENCLTAQVAVELAGKAFDEGIAGGANHSSSMSFGLEDEEAAREKALERAVKSAHKEAKIVTGAAAVRLEGPRSMEIVNNGGMIYLARKSESSSTPTPVFPGMLTISAQVSIVYEFLYS